MTWTPFLKRWKSALRVLEQHPRLAVRRMHWLVIQTWTVWITILAIPVAFLFSWSSVSGPEPAIRWTGMYLQLFGLITVAIGLYETARAFGRHSAIAGVRKWWKRWPSASVRIQPPTGPIALSGSAASVVGAGAALGPFSIEDRLTALEKSAKDQSASSARIEKLVEDEVGERWQAVEVEARKREEGDEANEKRLKDLSVDGLHLEWMGAAWLLIGILLSSASVELAPWWAAITDRCLHFVGPISLR